MSISSMLCDFLNLDLISLIMGDKRSELLLITTVTLFPPLTLSWSFLFGSSWLLWYVQLPGNGPALWSNLGVETYTYIYIYTHMYISISVDIDIYSNTFKPFKPFCNDFIKKGELILKALGVCMPAYIWIHHLQKLHLTCFWHALQQKVAFIH